MIRDLRSEREQPGRIEAQRHRCRSAPVPEESHHSSFRALGTVRFVAACPFLLAGIGLVLLGRIIMEREDRLGFDRQYFGPTRNDGPSNENNGRPPAAST